MSKKLPVEIDQAPLLDPPMSLLGPNSSLRSSEEDPENPDVN